MRVSYLGCSKFTTRICARYVVRAILYVAIRWSGTWLILLLMLTSAATDTVLFADPRDVTVEANQWAQFNCTVHCTHTRSVGWYMAGYDLAIRRNNTIPGLLIKRTSDSKCTSNQKIHYFEVYATEAWNKSTFYCAAYEKGRSCSCGKEGRCYSRPALLTGEPVLMLHWIFWLAVFLCFS